MRVACGALALFAALTMASTVSANDPPPIFANQGPDWNDVTRNDFYTRDQGSRVIPLAWLRALDQANGQPFLADGLARYGYLPNPANSNGLPVGFTASGPTGSEVVGMSCAACHTRQITAEGKSYRIDGGPAIVDFQSFLSDLDAAVGRALASDAAFAGFAKRVLNSSDPDDAAVLRRDIDAWYLRFHTLVSRALPDPSWGPGRLDAISMIFNRLTGLDIGPPPTFLIADNIRKADAPVRYPFLWNAPRHDRTQWLAFADNGNDILALARNLGQVFGVFATFEPRPNGLVIDFLNNNSANFDGLGKLEGLVKKIGAPKWPWLIDTNLAAQGKAIYARPAAEGGCQSCHGIAPGQVRFFLQQTWRTPAQNVGTDTRAYDILTRTAKTGVLKGGFIPLAVAPLNETDLAFNVLALSVIGSIAQNAVFGIGDLRWSVLVASEKPSDDQLKLDIPDLNLKRLPPHLRDLETAFHAPPQPKFKQLDLRFQGKTIPEVNARRAALVPKGTYEARVLQGIWAAAPYLHNGSVPTLAELLKPAAQRVKQFKMGSAYDIDNVGIAVEQTQFGATIVTTDCSELNSGNSRCGHEYGTQLKDEEKKALLEYLKGL